MPLPGPIRGPDDASEWTIPRPAVSDSTDRRQLTIQHEATAAARDAARDAAAVRATMTDALIVIARDLLRADADHPNDAGATRGVSFDQVREIAERRRIVPERGCPSIGASVMKKAGGLPQEFRPSKHRLANNRLVRVFRLRG